MRADLHNSVTSRHNPPRAQTASCAHGANAGDHWLLDSGPCRALCYNLTNGSCL